MLFRSSAARAAAAAALGRPALGSGVPRSAGRVVAVPVRSASARPGNGSGVSRSLSRRVPTALGLAAQGGQRSALNPCKRAETPRGGSRRFGVRQHAGELPRVDAAHRVIFLGAPACAEYAHAATRRDAPLQARCNRWRRVSRPRTGIAEGWQVPDRQAHERLEEWRVAERAEAETRQGSDERRRAHASSRRARWKFEDAARSAREDHGSPVESFGAAMRRALTRLHEASDNADLATGGRERAKRAPETDEERGRREDDEAEFARDLRE